MKRQALRASAITDLESIPVRAGAAHSLCDTISRPLTILRPHRRPWPTV